MQPRVSLLSVSVRNYGQNKTITYYMSLWDHIKASISVQNSVSDSYMDAVFELVADEVRDLGKSATQFYQDRLTTLHMTKLEREAGGSSQRGL